MKELGYLLHCEIYLCCLTTIMGTLNFVNQSIASFATTELVADIFDRGIGLQEVNDFLPSLGHRKPDPVHFPLHDYPNVILTSVWVVAVIIPSLYLHSVLI